MVYVLSRVQFELKGQEYRSILTVIENSGTGVVAESPTTIYAVPDKRNE